MNLCGKFLIAMPGMLDPRFARAVILMCAHSSDGAMGLIVNRPTAVPFAELLAQLGIADTKAGRAIRVQRGGPVDPGRGFVLHSPDYDAGQSTLAVTGGYAMTSTPDILTDLARGEGPGRAFLALGYTGWGSGQLEAEIGRNDWLTSDAVEDLVFAGNESGTWVSALRHMGVEPVTLSATAGRA